MVAVVSQSFLRHFWPELRVKTGSTGFGKYASVPNVMEKENRHSDNICLAF